MRSVGRAAEVSSGDATSMSEREDILPVNPELSDSGTVLVQKDWNFSAMAPIVLERKA